MKKILLPLVALMLSVTATNAQVQGFDNDLQAVKATKIAPKANVLHGQKKAYAPTKADETALTDAQRYIGNVGSDMPNSFVGVPGAKTQETGTVIPASVLQKYAGDKIIGARFCLLKSIGATTVRLNYSDGQDERGAFKIGEEIASKELASTEAVTKDELVWNEVRFDTPYTIPAKAKDLKIGFDYTQKKILTADGKGYTDECMPLGVNTTQGSVNGFLLKAEFTDKVTGQPEMLWAPVASNDQWVNLCIQVLVEREGGFVQDIVMGSLSSNKFAWKDNGSFAIGFSCYNDGSKPIKDYVFGLAIDNNEIATMVPGLELNNEYQVFGTNGIKIPENVGVGTHILSVYVKSMNGAKPTGEVKNDTLSSVLRVYNDCMKKQLNLVEHFTSQGCSNCPYGYDVLNALTKLRKDIAWVAIHNNFSSDNDDDYVCDGGKYITYYSTRFGYPYANFNRYFIPNSQINAAGRVAVPIGYTNYNEAASIFSQFIDESNKYLPSFVNLNVTADYDADNDGELTLTVKGTGVKDAAKILQGARLTIYLTEDGQISSQLYGSSVLKKYKHDHILRMIVTGPSGDAINWDGDNFEATYAVNIPEDYDYTQMHAIAFVNNTFAVFDNKGELYAWNGSDEDVWVSNCNMVDIKDGNSTGISTVVPAESKTVVARYAADGTQLSAPVKGINIVKYSDGTSQTVLVK